MPDLTPWLTTLEERFFIRPDVAVLAFFIGSALGTLIPFPRREWAVAASGLTFMAAGFLVGYLGQLDSLKFFFSLGAGLVASFFLIPPYRPQQVVDEGQADTEVEEESQGEEDGAGQPEVGPAPQERS
jgi:peptidoglycan/LPS O-acetylase OafA/YrhL